MSTTRTLTLARLLSPAALVCLGACGEASAGTPSPQPAFGGAASDRVAPAASPASTGYRPLAPEDIQLPTPKVELPELPFDKEHLAEVRRMDAMIVDSRNLAAAVTELEAMFHALEAAADVSMSGTSEDQIRATMAVVDGFREFDGRGIPFAEKARAAFESKYADDEVFSTAFRETYSRAEEELYTAIEDNVLRRSTGSALTNGYRYASGSNLSYLIRMLEESGELRARAVDRVVQSVETDLMVADYKKGKELTDLLQSSRGILDVVSVLEPDGQRIADILERVSTKEAARQAEVAAARESYRFPERHDGPNLPSNYSRLEKELRDFMERSDYDVERVTVASGWIAVRSELGIHLYDQLDFYAAVPSREDSEVLDVLYVTGKTSGPEPGSAITRISVGVIGQMLEENL